MIVTAQNVTLGKHAVIDASGTGNGGTVLIGGDRQGGAVKARNFAKHAIANAQTTTVEAGAQILADGGAGGGAGTGGNVVVWSDKHTVFAGAISVTGGAQGGDGGFVETSSHGVLDFTGTADRLAPKGKAGTLLLDPDRSRIVAARHAPAPAPSRPARTITAKPTQLATPEPVFSASFGAFPGGSGRARSTACSLSLRTHRRARREASRSSPAA